MLRLVYLGYVLLALTLSALTAHTAPTLPAEVAAYTAPLFGIGHRMAQNLRAAGRYLFDRRDLRTENAMLREEVAWLKEGNLELKVEVERLRRALEVHESQAPNVVAVAPVISEDTSGLYRRLILGMGDADGLSVGMPVTSAHGLVGVIIETTAHRAVVRTIVDPESRVGVRPADAPGRGIAYGEPPASLRVELPVETQIAIGDVLVTGSLRGLFPEGIPVARVTAILPRSPGALRKVVRAEPLVKFGLLEEVVVLGKL